MKKLIIASAAAAVSASVFAGLYGDTPDAKHAWAVHDWNRPKPVKVCAEPGKPPSVRRLAGRATSASLPQEAKAFL